MDLIGQIIKDYEFRRLLASGGYGAVYEAMDVRLNRLVAIKTTLPEYANQPEFQQRFESEIQLITQLEHPHIVPIYHHWQDERGAFLVMRYVKGGSLRDVMEIHGSLSLIQTRRIMRQLCDALDIAHHTGVIHRDIKPENILLDAQGNAYLTDFGIAKNLHTDDDITATGGVVGTWKYLSPEQIKEEPLFPQTDLYSLGIMLYEMLAGEHPFKNTPVTMMLMKHLQDNLPDIRDVRADLSRELNAVIQRATMKNPVDRYPNVSAFINAFHNVLDGVPGSLTIADTEPNITKPILVKPPVPRTHEERNRHAMLQNVRKFWIEGVLESSLQNIDMLNLDVSQDNDSVDHPWQKLLNLSRSDTDEPLGSRQVMSYFENLNGKLLVMGAPGAGKTTMLLTLTAELLNRATYDPAYPIPVVLNLSSWSQARETIEQWLEDELHIKYQTPRRVARNWIEHDQLTLMLDGLDEVDLRYRNDCVNAINRYRERHGFVDIVLCCRTHEYHELLDKVMLNGAIRIEPLTDVQIQRYLDTLRDGGERVRRLIENDPTFHELSRTPLTLRILVQTYRNIPTSAVEILDNPADQRRQLFERYVHEMISRRISDVGYDGKTIHKQLSWLARQMRLHNLSIFQIEDLQPSWLNPVDQVNYERLFAGANIITQAMAWGLPRLLQADEIVGMSNLAKTLIWSVSGTVWGLVLGVGSWRRWWIPWLCGIVFAMGIAVDSSPERGTGVFATMPISVVIYGGLLYVSHLLMKRNDFDLHHVHTVELLKFSRHHVHPLPALIGAMAGVATAFVNNAAYNGDPATQTELIIGMVLGAISGGVGAVFIGGLRASPSPATVRPNRGIRHTLRNAIRMGFFIAITFFTSIFLATTPVSTVSFGITQGAISAIAFGFMGFIIFGGYPVMQHLVIRYLLVRRQSTQQNIAHFLDTASDLLLMRKVGGGYIFIHRYLLEYFAEMDDLSTK